MSLLKLKSESMEKDPNEWILNLQGLQIGMNKVKLKGSVSDEDFMIHILNNFPKEHDRILNGLKNFLTASGDNVLTINMICKKLNHQY